MSPALSPMGWRTLVAQGRGVKVALLALGVWLHAADALLVATVMPSAVLEIGGVAYISWTVFLYHLGAIAMGAACGLLALRLGLRNAMAGCGVIYAAGCAASAVAPDMGVMLLGRVAQGLGGGGMVALAHIGVIQLFPPPLWPRYIAVLSAVWGLSAFCGPLIGGIFANLGLWRWGFGAFFVQACILTLAIAHPGLGLDRKVQNAEPSSTTEEKENGGALAAPGFPAARLAALCASVVCVAQAGMQATLWLALILGVAGIGALAGFFWLDHHAQHNRLYPPRPFHPGTHLGGGVIMILALTTGTIAFTTYGPLLVGLIYGLSPLEAGYMVALESVSWTIAAIVFSGVTTTRAENRLIRAGTIAIALSMVGLVWAVPYGSVLGTVAFLALQGGGFGAAWGYVIRKMVNGVPQSEVERASACVPTTQWLGYAMGAALCGMVANASGLNQLDPVASPHSVMELAQTTAFWLFASFIPIALLGLWAAWRLTRPQA